MVPSTINSSWETFTVLVRLSIWFWILHFDSCHKLSAQRPVSLCDINQDSICFWGLHSATGEWEARWRTLLLWFHYTRTPRIPSPFLSHCTRVYGCTGLRWVCNEPVSVHGSQQAEPWVTETRKSAQSNGADSGLICRFLGPCLGLNWSSLLPWEMRSASHQRQI